MTTGRKYTGTCGAIMTRGPRKGQPCGVGCAASVGRCAKHIKSRVVPSGVTWIHKMPVDVVELILAHKRHGEWEDEFKQDGDWWSTNTADIVRRGDLALLQWAVREGCPWDSLTTLLIARGGHFEMLEWAMTNSPGSVWDPCTMNELVHRQAPLKVLKRCLEQGCPLPINMVGTLVETRQREVLEWLICAGCPWERSTTRRIAYTNDLDLMQWAIANGCQWSAGTMLSIVTHAHGDEAMLRWSVTNGCPWDCDTTYFAASRGKWGMLKLAVSLGCVWDPQTIRAIADSNDAARDEMLKWSVANGCPWHPHITVVLIRKRRFETLMWAIREGCPWHPQSMPMLLDAGDRGMLKWAIDHEIPLE